MATTAMSREQRTVSKNGALIRVGPRADLDGVRVVSGGRHGIAVFAGPDGVYAVDNRCPHMGFPLHKGSVCDGILTCHWHHARFDLASGGTFDPWADDVTTYEVVIEDDVVYVDPRPRSGDRTAYWKGRLRDGLEQNLNLVLVKNVLNLIEAGTSPAEILEVGGVFGTTYRRAGWRAGLTILTAMGNILPTLTPEDRALALYHGLVHTANDSAGQPPRFALDPLPDRDVPLGRLKAWFRRFVAVRDSDGAERALLTAIASGASHQELADLLVAAATDRFYLNGGHTIDFVNKACEHLDLIGWEHAGTILPSLVPVLTGSRRSEELNTWRHPVDLVALVEPVLDELPELFVTAQADPSWRADEAFLGTLLGEDPAAIVVVLRGAIAAGALQTELTRGLCIAAARRVARFHTSNEFGDWITVLHTFTAASALHRLAKRSPSPELARGLFHGAMQLHLDRFLNQPAARLPEEQPTALEALPAEVETLLDQLRELLDREQQVGPAALVTQRYLSLRHDPAPLIATLGQMLLREDGEFHSYQMLEAGVVLHEELTHSNPAEAARVLVAVTRYLAAHAPTSRAMLQTANIARRLQRGDDLTIDEDAPEAAG